MLNKIRNNVTNNKPVKALLIIAVIAFVFWGTGLQSMSFSKTNAIKVGSVEISPTEYFRAYQMAKQQIAAQFNGQEIPAELMKMFNVESRVSETLISQALLEDYANSEDIYVDNKSIIKLIAQEKAFQKDGKFDKDTYIAMLRQAQLTPIEFENSLVKKIQAQIIMNMFNNTVNISDTELEMQVKFEQERRDVDVLTLSPKDIATIPDATEDEIIDLYENNKEQFVIPEKRDYKLLAISKKELAKQLTTTDEDVKAFYEDNKDDYFTKPEFLIKQILVKSEEKANEVLNLADLNKNFDNYVAQYSKDTFSKDKKGDMGWLTADIFGAEFENIVHSLEKGKTATKAVKTAFGYHIFKLVDVKPSTLKSFDEVKDKIKAQLLSEQAEDLLTSKINTALDMAAAGEKLESIAKQVGFEISTFENKELDEENKYTAEAFKTSEGEISQPIELDFETTAFVEVSKVVPQSFKPLDEVKDNLMAEFKANKTTELLNKKAEDVLASIQADELSFKDAAKKFGLISPVQSIVDLARADNTKKEISNEMAYQIFLANTDSVINKTFKADNRVLIVKVTNAYQAPITAEQKQNIKDQLVIEKTNDLYFAFVDKLRKETKVKINKRVIDQVIAQVK